MRACTCVRLGRRIETVVAVLDLRGCSIGMTGGAFFRLVNAWTKVDSDHYPERMGTVFLINVPSVFSIVWKAIRPLLDPRTARKIHIHRRGYHDAVAAVVGEDNLPDGWRQRHRQRDAEAQVLPGRAGRPGAGLAGATNMRPPGERPAGAGHPVPTCQAAAAPGILNNQPPRAKG